jgi:hypothetical protein
MDPEFKSLASDIISERIRRQKCQKDLLCSKRLLDETARLFSWVDMFAWPSGVRQTAFCRYDMASEISVKIPCVYKATPKCRSKIIYRPDIPAWLSRREMNCFFQI